MKKTLKWSSRSGAALTEYIVIGLLAGVFSIGSISVFSDDIRALFATADNGLAGIDSTPVTRPGKAESYSLAGKKASGMGPLATGPTTAQIQQAIRDTAHTARWDFENGSARRDDFKGPLWDGYKEIQTGGSDSGFSNKEISLARAAQQAEIVGLFTDESSNYLGSLNHATADEMEAAARYLELNEPASGAAQQSLRVFAYLDRRLKSDEPERSAPPVRVINPYLVNGRYRPIPDQQYSRLPKRTVGQALRRILFGHD